MVVFHADFSFESCFFALYLLRISKFMKILTLPDCVSTKSLHFSLQVSISLSRETSRREDLSSQRHPYKAHQTVQFLQSLCNT